MSENTIDRAGLLRDYFESLPAGFFNSQEALEAFLKDEDAVRRFNEGQILYLDSKTGSYEVRNELSEYGSAPFIDGQGHGQGLIVGGNSTIISLEGKGYQRKSGFLGIKGRKQFQYSATSNQNFASYAEEHKDDPDRDRRVDLQDEGTEDVPEDNTPAPVPEEAPPYAPEPPPAYEDPNENDTKNDTQDDGKDNTKEDVKDNIDTLVDGEGEDVEEDDEMAEMDYEAASRRAHSDYYASEFGSAGDFDAEAHHSNLALQLRPEFKNAFKNAGLLQQVLNKNNREKEMHAWTKFNYVPYGDGEQTISSEMGRNEIVNSNAKEKKIRFGGKLFRTSTMHEPVGSNVWSRNSAKVHMPHRKKPKSEFVNASILQNSVAPLNETLISVQGHNLIVPEASISIPTYVQDRNLIGSFELGSGRPNRKKRIK